LDGEILPFGRLGPNGEFYYIYRRRVDAAVRGLNYAVQGSFNLWTGKWITNGLVEVSSGPINAEFESVTNEVQLGDSAFGRLKIHLKE